MASLKDLRNRIASIEVTRKMTKAMQMVAAAKLRHAQETASSARHYSQKMADILENISVDAVSEDMSCLMAGTGKNDTHLVVVCTSERGLCGGFNMQIARVARDFIGLRLTEGKIVKILTVGKKGADILKRDFNDLIIDHVDLRAAGKVDFASASAIASKVIAHFNADLFDVCTLVYSEFKSVTNRPPVCLQLIPLPATPVRDRSMNTTVSVVYEPDIASVLDELVSKNVSVQIFRALLENAAGEMSARMSAMDNATRNAGEMIHKLSIVYNRQRQTQITTDLIEIIAGAEAL